MLLRHIAGLMWFHDCNVSVATSLLLSLSLRSRVCDVNYITLMILLYIILTLSDHTAQPKAFLLNTWNHGVIFCDPHYIVLKYYASRPA